jgi:hypothetical protein
MFCIFMVEAYEERKDGRDTFNIRAWRFCGGISCAGWGVQIEARKAMLRRIESDDGEEETGRCRHSYLQ